MEDGLLHFRGNLNPTPLTRSVKEFLETDIVASDGSWRMQVLERDNYHCQFCGRSQIKHRHFARAGMISHHILPREPYPEYINDPDNGVTVCRGDCHNTVAAAECLKILTLMFLEEKNKY